MVFGNNKHGVGRDPTRQDQPILPPALANSLVETTRATLGFGLLGALALMWLALITWSSNDPSFTKIGLDSAKNALGLAGAYVADAAIQSLGLATFAVLLAPMFWAIAMVRAEPAHGRIATIIAYVLGVALLSTAASYWRTIPGWPLPHGLGGIGGDQALALAMTPLAPLGDLARITAAGVALVLGLISTLRACGMRWPRRQRNRSTVRQGGPRSNDRSSSSPPAGPTSDTVRWGRDPLEPMLPDPAFEARVQPSTTYPAQAGVAHGSWSHVDPITASLFSNQSGPTARSGHTNDSQRYGPYAASAHDPYDWSAHEGGAGGAHDDNDAIDFDAWTDASSSGIAKRFAPTENTPRALQTSLTSAFGLGMSTGHQTNSQDRKSRSDRAMATGPRGEIGQRGSAEQAASSWRRPTLNLLAKPSNARSVSAYGHALHRGIGRLIADALAEFGIVGTMRDVEPGPVVTTFLFEIARSTKLSRVIALASDIAHQLNAPSLRISERQGLVAIEWPNPDRAPIVLRDCLDSDAYRSELDALPISLGIGTTGLPVIADLAQLSGVLVSGGETSAKANGLNAMILSLIYRHGPEDCRFLLIDPRMVDLAIYDGIPHLLTPVVADPHKAITALAWCVREMEDRTKRMSFLGVRNIELFNNRVRNAKKRGEVLQRNVQTGFDERTGKARFETQNIDLAPMPYIVVVIEELADLMAVAGREIEGSVARLAKAARAVGIHLIVATDRPTADIVTTPIRDSLPARVSYRTQARGDSRSVIGDDGAEHLLPGGDSLLSHAGSPAVRIHGPHVSAEEAVAVAMHLKDRGAPEYVEGLDRPTPNRNPARSSQVAATATAPASASPTAPQPTPVDDLYDRAVAIAVRDGGANIGHLQNTLKVSAGWAASLLARLEADAVVGPADARGVHRLKPPDTRVA